MTNMAVKKILKKEPPPSTVTMPVPQEDPELSASAKRMLVQAQALTVTTAEEYEEAGEVLLRLNSRAKEVEAQKATLWDPLAVLTKNVQAIFNPPLKVLDTAKKLVSSKMGAYAQEQANIALERQRLADEEAEEARQKLLAKAEKASDDGNHARAVILEARADSVQAPTIEAETPQVAGLKLVPRWLFEVTDESLVPRKFLMVDERLIRAEVNAQQANAKIPGVRIWSTLKPQG
jgi:hypothetical protein